MTNETEFVPFGDEWKAAMMKHSKVELIDFYRRQGIAMAFMQEENEGLKELLIDIADQSNLTGKITIDLYERIGKILTK